MENTTHYIYGMRAVTEAVRSGRKFEKVLFKQGMEGSQYRELLDALMQNDIPFQFVPFQKLNSLVKGAHQGVVAYISQIDYVPYEEMIELAMSRKEAPLFLLLDGVSDVRNFGAIARTCECAGVDAIIIPVKGGASVNADAIKTSAGALHTLPVCKESSLTSALKFMKKCGVRIVAASEKGTLPYTESNMKDPVAIVMGAEDKGVSPEVLRICDEMVSIPILGKISSLNVSVAAGVMIYEAVRQRGAK